ncbi:MAG: NAD(P)-dependent oxidoreductase [Candidatus Latescibacteria bacterium]|nr:NAD(P)-dependent oxidoreductase [Candidatus Latescibacterota bacterium]
MMHRRLAALDKKGTPIRVGLVGCGRMGMGVINQVSRAPGMRVVAVADQERDRAEQAARAELTPPARVCATDDLTVAERALARGEVVASAEGRLVCRLPLDVVVEATGIPESGAQVAYEAILQRKHVVALNVETDAVIGPILKHLADSAGVVYTVTAGDEPGVMGGMYEWATSIGLEVVAAVKGCMRPIDWNANPQTLAGEAAALGLNPKMLASFRDGSKHCVEVCVVANGTGLVPDVRGTHARPLSYAEIPRYMRPKKDGGILSRSGVVELSPPVLKPDGSTDLEKSVTPGVYLVVTSDYPQIRADFTYLLMGEGPYYVLHRPYHLCAIETPYSIARAFLYGDATLSPLGAPVAEVISVAKRDLAPGDWLTGSGGAEVTGQIDLCAVCRRENLLPLGLSYEVQVKRPVSRGQALTLEDVHLPEELLVYRLWQLQRSTFG